MVSSENQSILPLVEVALWVMDRSIAQTVLEAISRNTDITLANLSTSFPDIEPLQLNAIIDRLRVSNVLSVDSHNENVLALTDDGDDILKMVPIFLAIKARNTM